MYRKQALQLHPHPFVPSPSQTENLTLCSPPQVVVLNLEILFYFFILFIFFAFATRRSQVLDSQLQTYNSSTLLVLLLHTKAIELYSLRAEGLTYINMPSKKKFHKLKKISFGAAWRMFHLVIQFHQHNNFLKFIHPVNILGDEIPWPP